jgi:hypothetical protein
MIVTVKLFVSGLEEQPVHTATIEIPDDKMELLDEEEKQAAVEMNVRTWAEHHLILDWEVSDS